MKVPVSWLRQLVEISKASTEELCDKLTKTGTKVETVEKQGAEISGVVVGKITEIYKHPNADRLFVTKTDIGDKTVQIVTGAQNLKTGDFIPVALDGATLANELKIKKSTMRGEVSEGMLCSINELGYTRQDYPEAPEDGIYVFTQPQPLGADVVPLMQLRDDVIEFEITSNRADCFSVIGIARETAAALDTVYTPPSTVVKEEAGGAASDYIDVSIENPALCPRYCARVIKNVKTAPSPLWLRHRLTACGIRPINNIVDITNYVMLEYGQPMHAFDIDNIEGRKIIVRNAQNGEVFITLDGQERVLESTMTVISDPAKAVAIGGVMGGENSKVTDGASAVLLESACFYGPNIRQTSKKLGLRTDSSTKFEKGLDPNLCLQALNRAAALVEELGCGSVVSGVVDCYPNKREPVTVPFDDAYINGLLGTKIPREQMIRILNSIDISVNGDNALIPTYRPDITIKADLAEETARLYGYDNIEPTLRSGTGTIGKRTVSRTIAEYAANIMLYSGFCEMMSFSFESPKVFDKLLLPENAQERKTITITNPLGEDFSIMRTTALNGLLESLSTNYNRRNETAALFETAKVYSPRENELPLETVTLSFGAYGSGYDFFVFKGIIENLCSKLGLKDVSYTKRFDIPYMHPGRCAAVLVNGECAGIFGEVHPTVRTNYEIGSRTLIASLNMALITQNADLTRKFKPLPKFPAVKRDIALIVADDVTAAKLESAIRERAGKNLESVTLFDVYTGGQIEKGCKSVAYSLIFRAPDKTLTEEEISRVTEKILKNLEVKTGAKLR